MTEDMNELEKYQKLILETKFPTLSADLAKKLIKGKQYQLMGIDSRQAMIQIERDLYFIKIDEQKVTIQTKILLHKI